METVIQQANISTGPEGVLKARICHILQWDDLRYYNYQFETGIAYLEYYIPTDPEGQAMLIRSSTFWKWWKNHWHQRDGEFIDRSLTISSMDILRDMYAEMNDASTLAKAIYPNGVVLEMSYSEMIQQLFDREIHSL